MISPTITDLIDFVTEMTVVRAIDITCDRLKAKESHSNAALMNMRDDILHWFRTHELVKRSSYLSGYGMDWHWEWVDVSDKEAK